MGLHGSHSATIGASTVRADAQERTLARAGPQILDAHQFDAAPVRLRVASPQEPKEPAAMATVNTDLVDDDVPDEPIPMIQQLLDNPFLLLFFGISVPTVLYIVWGVMEIVGI